MMKEGARNADLTANKKTLVTRVLIVTYDFSVKRE
jgi:hypothetical protein